MSYKAIFLALVFVFGVITISTLATQAAEPLSSEATTEGFELSLISLGQDHSCGLTAEGEVYCWGSNKEGQLGIGSFDEVAHPVPARVSGDLKFTTLDSGQNHTCGLTDEGVAYCWGENKFGQLGNGTLISAASPVPVSGDLRFRTIIAGAAHTCGIDTSGIAYCWGGNWHGQLGAGTMDGEEQYPCCYTSPVPVVGGLSFSSVQAGGIHTCGLTLDGEAYCWGNHKNYGQLGTGDADLRDRPIPVPVAGGLKFVSISAGLPSCGIVSNGTAYCWGGGPVPELGIRSGTAPWDRPAPVSKDLTFERIASGTFFACGIVSGGALYCWGYNRFGQIGNGSTENVDLPQLISSELKFRLVAAGGGNFSGHACGITTDGETLCWGDNRRGQLGNGSTIQSSRPVLVTQPDELSSAEAATEDAHKLLAEANRLSWLFNWPAAGPLYKRAEELFTQVGDERNALHARIGRLRASIVIGTLALAGCPSFSGGGWISSACDQNPAFLFPFTCTEDSTAKATFGFDLNCDEGTGSGELQYRDHGILVTGSDLKERKLSIHGEVNDAREPCGGIGGFGGPYTGSYTPQPPTMGAPGTFEVFVVDSGERGPNKGDLIQIQLFDGVFDGYSNGVPNGKELQGGNIALQE